MLCWRIPDAGATDPDGLMTALRARVGHRFAVRVRNLAPEDVWRPKSGANENFSRYLRREVLGKLQSRLVWGLDELDRFVVTRPDDDIMGPARPSADGGHD